MSKEIQGLTVFNSNEVDTKSQPMFFGKPLGVQRYDTYKYPIFEKLTVQQLGYFWRPEEVSLQKDRGDYLTLRPEQKHIYTSNLKYQIMLDSVQGRGPAMAFLPYCSLPELEACIEAWGFMEMIHSRSYTYIIKNIYSDPTTVFDTIIHDEKILERAESVTGSYDDFINSAHYYGVTDQWKHNNEGVEYAQQSLYELKRKLYLAIMNVNILEGIRFYVSFACSFAFGELKLMEGSAKIISLISRDENCFHKNTEILTEKGWKKFSDLNKTEKVAQYTKEGNVEFVNPLHYTKKHYKGKLYQFENAKGHFSQVVTDEHRIIWRKAGETGIREDLAKDFNGSCAKHFIVSGKGTGKVEELTSLERFRIAVQADGCIRDKNIRNGNISGCHEVAFNFSKERKMERLEQLLTELGYEYSTWWQSTSLLSNKKRQKYYRVKVPVEMNIEKNFNWINLEDVSYLWCQEFIKELSHWDGYRRYDDYSNIYYSTSDSTVADMVQAVAALSGWRCHRGIQIDDRKESYSDIYRLTILSSRDCACVGPKESVTSILDYDDYVYCVTVPSGMIVTRHDNKVVVTGNCHLAITQNILNKWSSEDSDMRKIAKEEEQNVYRMFENAVNEEKRWADYLFKDGSMIGLNDKLLYQYIEWIANRRLKAIGFTPQYDIPAKNNPLPWTQYWISSKEVQVAPQETQNSSYLVGGIRQDMKSDAFSGFKL